MAHPFTVFAAMILTITPVAAAPIPRDVVKPKGVVHVIGVYEGTVAPGIRGRGHPQGNITVTVPAETGPVILVLTAYEPVRWTINAPKGSVERVITSGYHGQAVEGLKDVPVDATSHQAGNADYFYAYQQAANPADDKVEQAETKRQYDRLVERVKALTQKDIKSFQGSYRGSTFEVK